MMQRTLAPGEAQMFGEMDRKIEENLAILREKLKRDPAEFDRFCKTQGIDPSYARSRLNESAAGPTTLPDRGEVRPQGGSPASNRAQVIRPGEIPPWLREAQERAK